MTGIAGCWACAASGQAAAEPATTLMKSRRRTQPSRCEVKDDASFRSLSDQGGNVRFGSEADMCTAPAHVRFTPNSDHKSGHRQAAIIDYTTAFRRAASLNQAALSFGVRFCV
jgi:hypothetical protein